MSLLLLPPAAVVVVVAVMYLLLLHSNLPWHFTAALYPDPRLMFGVIFYDSISGASNRDLGFQISFSHFNFNRSLGVQYLL